MSQGPTANGHDDPPTTFAIPSCGLLRLKAKRSGNKRQRCEGITGSIMMTRMAMVMACMKEGGDGARVKLRADGEESGEEEEGDKVVVGRLSAHSDPRVIVILCLLIDVLQPRNLQMGIAHTTRTNSPNSNSRTCPIHLSSTRLCHSPIRST